MEFLEGGGVLGGRPVDLAGLEWSTGSGSRRCGKEQSCGRHGGEDGAARWGRDVSEEKAGARGERGRRAGASRPARGELGRAGAGVGPSQGKGEGRGVRAWVWFGPGSGV